MVAWSLLSPSLITDYKLERPFLMIYYFHPPLLFMGEKSKAQRGEVVCPCAFHLMGFTLSC